MKIKYACDAETVEIMEKAIRDNHGYCPCKVDKTSDTKCMCKEFRDFVKSGQLGTCHCGLYVSYDPTNILNHEPEVTSNG